MLGSAAGDNQYSLDPHPKEHFRGEASLVEHVTIVTVPFPSHNFPWISGSRLGEVWATRKRLDHRLFRGDQTARAAGAGPRGEGRGAGAGGAARMKGVLGLIEEGPG
jgi:hypothetical protein